MNPFDLPGPQFLLFYIGLSAVVIVALILTRRAAESSSAPKIDLSDPFLIAYLRGGEAETLRVATVSLVDRGLLVVNGTQLQRAEHAQAESVRRPIEKELLHRFNRPDEAASIFNDARLKAQCKPFEQALQNAGLLPGESTQRARLVRLFVAGLILTGVGFVKIVVALSRGRTNIGFLVVLMIVAVVIAVKVAAPRLTEPGKVMLADLQNLYSALKGRALSLQPGGASIEPLMLAAVFGVTALEAAGFAFTRVLFPRPKKAGSGSSWGSSSCGSSCSSSSCSSSSCGSSCGGGGCGGGCGGCGG